MFRPRNFSEQTSMPYMDPQPPEMSCTTSSVGANSANSRSQTCDSPSERYVGFSGVLAEGGVVSCGCAEAEAVGNDVENWRATSLCSGCARGSEGIDKNRVEMAAESCRV